MDPSSMNRGSFSAYWRGTRPFLHTAPFNLPSIISFSTFIYLLAKIGKFDWSAGNLFGYIVISIILCGLPFLHSVTYKNRLAALTAVVLQVSIISLESIYGRKQCMASYLAFVIIFRIMYYRTFFDNFALCLAFSSNVGATTRGEVAWYYDANLMVWSFFFIALFLQHIYKRNSARIWQHVRLLLIFKERIRFEKERCAALISSHLPKDIIDQVHAATAQVNIERASTEVLSPTLEGLHRVGRPLVINKADKLGTSAPCTPQREISRFIEQALNHNIVSEFEEGPTTAAMLTKLDHSDRRPTTAITIRIGGGGSECALDHKIRGVVFSILDQISGHYKVTPIRRFGSTWVGCLGFFHSLESDMQNCFATLQFACHVMQTLKKFDIQVAIAMDSGNMIGGFVNSPNFELFSQEMRLVFQLSDLQVFGRIVVGDTARQHLTHRNRVKPDNLTVSIERSPVNPPWIAGVVSSAHCINNTLELVRKDDLNDPVLDDLHQLLAQCFDVELIDVFNDPGTINKHAQGNDKSAARMLNCDRDYGFDFDILTPRPNYIDLIDKWNVGQTEIQQQYRRDERTEPESTTDGENKSPLVGYFQQCKDSWQSYWDPSFWMEDLGVEFRTSLKERYGFDVDDAFTLMSGTQGNGASVKYSEDDLIRMHEEMEREIYCVVKQVFLSSVKDMLSMGFYHEADDIEIYATKRSMKAKAKDSTRIINLTHPINMLIIPPVQEFFSTAFAESNQDNVIVHWVRKLFTSSKYNKIAVDNLETATQYSGPVQLHEREDFTDNKDDDQPVLINDGVTATADHSIDTSFFERSWQKYASDSRLTVHHSLVSFAINLVFFCVSFVVLRNYVIAPTSAEQFALIGFLQLYVLHCMLALTLERVYGRSGSIIMIGLRMLIFLYMPDKVLFNVLFSSEQVHSEYGDFGGDVSMLLFLVFRIPSHMHQSASLSLLDGVISRAIILIRQFSSGHYWMPQAHLSGILVLLVLDFCYWVIQHRSFVSYLVEHRLLPYALDQYREQVVNTRKILHILSPEAAYKFNKDIFKPNFYRNCALAAVHIKAADKLSSFLGPQDFCNIMDRVNEMVDEAFAESGMLKVSSFSGVHVAVVCKDASWDRITGLRVPSSHTARVVLFLRVVRARLDKFCKINNINIAVGLGITAGPACLGFLGCNFFHFDIEGDVRDRAVCMASYNSDAVYVSSSVEQELAKVFPAEDLLHRQKVSDTWGDMYWFQIDSTFNGIQLNDFTYSGMLGKGGYGAVHLLCEKYTNKFYAIKAIPLKENSVMSRMMQRECIILQRMNHENVVKLKYAFIANNQLYLVMSYLSCGNLKQVIDRDGPSLQMLKIWFAELTLAIEYVHSVGIIHRDVKPANCMIDNKGHLKLADFGLSKIIRAPQGGEVSEVGNTPSSTLGVNEDVQTQLQKYLPLKAYLANRAVKEELCCVPVLYILRLPPDSDGSPAQLETSERMFSDSNFRMDITTVKDRYHAVPLLHNRNIEAIFIDGHGGGRETQDLIDTVRYLCSTLRSHIAIYILRAPAGLALTAIEAGAKECFEETMDQLDETTFRRLFSIHHDTAVAVKSERIEASTVFNPNNSTSTNTIYRSDMPNKDEEHTLVGTIHYIAPEVIKDRKYGEPVDWWALGITIYVCMVRAHVFQGDDPAELREKIANGPVELGPLKAIDEEAFNLVTLLLCMLPEQRLGSTSEGAAAIKKHRYFHTVAWDGLATMDLPYKPMEFKLGKYDLKEKLLFYGEPDVREKLHLSMQEMDERSSSSINRHRQNLQRLRSVKKNKHNLHSTTASRIHARQMQSKRLDLVKGHLSAAPPKDRNRDIENSNSSNGFYPVPEEEEDDQDRDQDADADQEQDMDIAGTTEPITAPDEPNAALNNRTNSLRSFSFSSMHADSL